MSIFFKTMGQNYIFDISTNRKSVAINRKKWKSPYPPKNSILKNNECDKLVIFTDTLKQKGLVYCVRY